MLGKHTIDKRSFGETRGSHGSSSRNYDILGRDLLSPDEVRKLDNRKCLVFVKGFDPILDFKYRTMFKPEFKTSRKLGKYVNPKELDELYLAERYRFYLDGIGETAIHLSYYIQTEDFHGIFEESKVYKDLFDAEDGNKRFPDSFGGYMYSECEVFPAFSKEVEEFVKSGENTLLKHTLIGYYLDEQFFSADEALLNLIFLESNRVTELMRIVG